MSTVTQTCDLVIPGYTLTERIGSGGYAEVWRAEAPGGIEKAVKIVHGYCDDEFASQELKALERIKGVRHPFLLSLERFDVINGRLVILTELADMSLEQRLRQCRADGLSGIPREELLRYMADAAEALDFLSKRHNLLHLDIKPENLLVLGDHIKVADFGLVKELATRTQNSLVSGMTPTYAAPEIFDDEPSVQSDQYSLAIVYQEMLVGTLPFPGRTAAQLAKQHTLAEPLLTSVPASDRDVLAKALAKNPTDRFASCKAFVDALSCRARTAVETPSSEPPRPISPAAPTATPPTGDTRPQSFSPTLRVSPGQEAEQVEVTVTRPVKRDQHAPTVPKVEISNVQQPIIPEEIVDVEVPPIDEMLRCHQPTLYLAVGGVGIQVLRRLHSEVIGAERSPDAHRLVETVILDTNRDELRQACAGNWVSPLSPDDAVHLPLRLPNSYDNARELLGWVSRRWLYNIPRSLETRGYRPLGRVALVDNAPYVLAAFDKKLRTLAASTDSAIASGASCVKTIKVVLLAGMGGGTGSGTAIDLANALKARANVQNLDVNIHGYFVVPNLASGKTTPLAIANTYSFLAELNHVAIHGNVSTAESSSISNVFESREPPFDYVYCVPGRTRGDKSLGIDALDALGKYLALDCVPEARGILQSCRNMPTQSETTREPWTLRTLGYSSLFEYKRNLASDLSNDLVEATKKDGMTDGAPAHSNQCVDSGSLNGIIEDNGETLLRNPLESLNKYPRAAPLVDRDIIAASLLECSQSGILQCGGDRRTLVITPRGQAPNTIVESLKTSRPLALVLQAAINDTFVVTEFSGISPRSLARGLERVFPGIAEAADRLHVRIDCEWSGLN